MRGRLSSFFNSPYNIDETGDVLCQKTHKALLAARPDQDVGKFVEILQGLGGFALHYVDHATEPDPFQHRRSALNVMVTEVNHFLDPLFALEPAGALRSKTGQLKMFCYSQELQTPEVKRGQLLLPRLAQVIEFK